MTGRASTPLAIALGYIKRGWNPVPVPYREKGPRGKSWQTRIIDAAAAPSFFNGASMNVGVILGPSSHGLTDVDLDCAKAIAIAPYILPPTKAIFGRPSKRGSHWLYVTDLAATIDNAALQFHDPVIKDEDKDKKKKMIIELRVGGGSRGAQTIFPGSTHEEGEAITWEEEGEPPSIKDDELRQRVGAVAAYALLARHWPGEGGRHIAAQAVGGFLARAGLTPSRAGNAAEAIARAAGDLDWRDRKKAAQDAVTAYKAGKRTYGVPKLIEMFGKGVADKVIEWLDYKGGNTEGLAEDQQPADRTLACVPASSFEMSAVEWLWPNRFALGELGLLAGLPDEGKSQILIDMGARVSRGLEWPCNEGHAPQGNVLLLTAEDNPNKTVVPRLTAAGADLDAVHIIQMVQVGDKKQMFNLVSDLDLLRRKILEVGNVKLILIDPVSAYLGVDKVDSFRTTDVRAMLGPLVELAGELMMSIVGMMHFNKKLDITNALLRISDSLAFGATARHVYAVVDDPENKRKLFVRAKNNLTPRSEDKTLACGFGLREVGHDPKTEKPISAPHILWFPHYVDVTAAEAMAAANQSKSPSARDDAKKFLTEILADGPMLSTEIEDAAKANGITRRTLFRAKDELQIPAKRDGPDNDWRWHPPRRATRQD